MLRGYIIYSLVKQPNKETLTKKVTKELTKELQQSPDKRTLMKIPLAESKEISLIC